MLTEREFEVLSRRAKKEDQAAIAKALKISQAAVSQFETNAHKKLLDAQKTLDLLGKTRATLQDSPTGTKVVYGGKKK